ncbi:piggyBac transposable element-derived protein 4-like [Acyrthosiphon pisum]|uniref:PiggyBac transposable element-derived protein domain-containing protein n=1 Tax=Acyrthosiphon pisum TaxID=7029 RepID=A0A8R2JLB9_ACYPI|nr:piggyBac transposable element-derived protein 4-like [Acyrthosiphon pisum]
MNVQRFRFLVRNLRFDDFTNRSERSEIDKLAPIRELFEVLVQNFQNNFIPTEYLTLDEQLIAFRGRCSFRQYIPNKPARYGIKIFALVDVKNAYTFNLEVYAGQQPNGPYKMNNSAESVVKRMVQPVEGTKRNITMDNWFTSLPVVKYLLTEKQLTVVGTLRKNKTCIPKEFSISKNREINSSLFGFQKDCIITSYVPKKNKVVILLSTLHNDASIDQDTGDQQKPEMITFYNQTKYGVDRLDQMCSLYDVSRNSRRWPLTIFFNLINISCINALNVYKFNNINNKSKRSDFLEVLALQLMKPNIERRIKNSKLPKHIRSRGMKILGLVEDTHILSERPKGIGRCYLCGRARNKSTRKSCERCYKWVCPDHLKYICIGCCDEEQSEESS